jgi:hypothetical protein
VFLQVAQHIGGVSGRRWKTQNTMALADVASKLSADRAYIFHAAGIMRTCVQLDPDTQQLYDKMIAMKSKFRLHQQDHDCCYDFTESYAGLLFNALSFGGHLDILY